MVFEIDHLNSEQNSILTTEPYTQKITFFSKHKKNKNK